MAASLYTSFAKGLKLKTRKFLKKRKGEVTGEKLVGGFSGLPSS